MCLFVCHEKSSLPISEPPTRPCGLLPSDDDDGDDDDGEYFDEFDYCGDYNNLVENKHHYGSGVDAAKEGRK